MKKKISFEFESSPTAGILTTRHAMSHFPFQPITGFFSMNKNHKDIQDSRAQLCCQRHRQKIDHRCQFTGCIDISWLYPFNSQTPCIFCNTIHQIDRVLLLLVNGFCLTNYEKYTTVFLFQFCFYTVKEGYQVSHPQPAGDGKIGDLLLQCMLLITCPSTRLLPFLCSSIRNRLSMIWLLTVRITSSGCACERFIP